MKKLIILFLVTSINIAFLTTYAQDCNPAIITNVEREGSGNRITWTMPAGEEKTISQGGDLGDWSTGYIKDFGVYHRFRPEDLSIVNAGTLTQVVFAPSKLPWQTELGHTFTIQIYKGGVWGAVGERNPGTLIYSKELNNNNLLINEENAIILEETITIDASQELWIGYYCTAIDPTQIGDKGSAGVDKDVPRKESLGNIYLSIWNGWVTMYEEAGSAHEYNWCIRGKVQTIDGLTVNIYHNNDKVDTDIQGTTYLHSNPTGEEHCYKIEVNCLEGGVSSLSNEICIKDNSIDEQIIEFNIYPNPVENSLYIIRSTYEKAKIEIYNVIGTIVQSFEINDIETKINTSLLSSGIYFIRLLEDNNSYMQRFIKK
jgi:hypothetical protein